MTRRHRAECRPKNPYRAAGHFIYARCGSAVPEYTLLLAFIVASGLGAYMALVARTDSIFKVASGLSDALVDRRVGSHAEATAGPASAATTHGPSPWFTNEQGTAARVVVGLVWLASWGLILLAGLVVWRASRGWIPHPRSPGHDADLPSTLPTMLDQLCAKRQQIRRLLVSRFQEPLAGDVQVQQLMSTDIVTIGPGVQSADATAIMKSRAIRHLLVCGKNGRLVGIVSDRDTKQRTGDNVECIMTREPITVSPETPLAPAITFMLSRGISCLPVVNETGEVCGILTSTDLMLSLQCTLQILAGVATELCPSATRQDYTESSSPATTTDCLCAEECHA